MGIYKGIVTSWMKTNINGRICMSRVNEGFIEDRDFNWWEKFLLFLGLL